jgi:hypothetical protein
MAAETQQADIDRLHELIRDALPDLEAEAGGYGPFHYRYASGREGDAHRISVAARKTGKSCIRFKRLDDLDLDALRALLVEAGRRPAPGAV